MIGCDMSMWIRPFFGASLPRGAGLGQNRLIIQRASGRREISILEIKGKKEFSPQNVLSCTCVKDWLRNDDWLGDFA
jgi:hypothetical protein